MALDDEPEEASEDEQELTLLQRFMAWIDRLFPNN